MYISFNTDNLVWLNIFCGKFILSAFLVCLFTTFTFSQSSDQNLPTPVTETQINGIINARDVGDSRLTSYYFVFNGNRGDIFINVVAVNLNGDIDIFTANGLEPKTKITLYSDNAVNETGRVIYMRKAEKLIMRVQGRTLNDDPATFQIKFAGSFEPIQGVAQNDVSDEPKVTASNDAKVKVNSVGTIIEKKPTPTPANKVVIVENKENADETVAENTTNESGGNESSNKNQTQIPPTFDPTRKVDDILKEASKENKPRLIIIDPLKNKETKDAVKTETDENNDSNEVELTVDLKDKPKNTSAIVRIERVNEEDTDDKKTEEKTNPLAKVFLKVELKNGDKFERSMVEVLSMNVIKGVLTIVTNDGKIIEYSILDVVKMTIE